MKGKTIILHICCAPCGTSSIERLMEDQWEITLYFSNSNIFPKEEYQRRLDEAKRLAEILSLPIIVDEYDHGKWLNAVSSADHLSPLRKEPEGGNRCAKCFRYALNRTMREAQERKVPCFTTTLTISPHKSSPQIFSIAKDFPGFEYYNFKKRGGFQRSTVLSSKHNLYRQEYCGCEFSISKKDSEKPN
jgi:epoxyqueuosine reductase